MLRNAAVAAAIIVSSLVPAAAPAQPEQDVAVFQRGTCVMQFARSARECHSLVYMHFAATGRSSFSVASQGGMATFSGTEYRAESGRHRALTVDRYYETYPGRDSEPRPATGECRVVEGAQGSVRTLTCDADAEAGRVHVEFTSDGSPPAVVNQPLG
jgi:hypothetical protein